jgi:anti-sigma factor RsiW
MFRESAMNDCPFQPRLSAYYDGELSDADHQAVKSHLARCAACSQELAAYGKLSLVLAQPTSAAIPAAALDRLRTRVRDSARQRWWRQAGAQFDRTVRRVTAVAAVILVGAMAALLSLPARNAQSTRAREVMTESMASSPDAITPTVYSPGSEERQMARWIVADLSQRQAPADQRP